MEQVMEYLIAHEDELNKEPPVPAVAEEAKIDNTTATDVKKDGESDETAVNMAARKKITVEEAQRIITERQAKRAEEERKKEIEDEKRRRLDGQKMAETRAELQDQERMRLAQQIRQEKLDKELHRKQVLDQIARDREAMKARNNASKQAEPSSSASASPSVTATKPKDPATECRIALRFPDGSNLIHKFSPQEQLSAVRLFVQMEKGNASEIEFIAPPNKKLSESSMNDTLESLGLCPASRLEVKFTKAKWSDLD